MSVSVRPVQGGVAVQPPSPVKEHKPLYVNRSVCIEVARVCQGFERKNHCWRNRSVPKILADGSSKPSDPPPPTPPKTVAADITARAESEGAMSSYSTRPLHLLHVTCRAPGSVFPDVLVGCH